MLAGQGGLGASNALGLISVADGERMRESGAATLARWLPLSGSQHINHPPRLLPKHLTVRVRKPRGEAGDGGVKWASRTTDQKTEGL